MAPSLASDRGCSPVVAAAGERAASLERLLKTRGNLAARFRLSRPDPPDVAAHVSEVVARTLADDPEVPPHSVECRQGICKIVVLRPPEQAIDRFDHVSPCTSRAMGAIMAYSWTQTNIAVNKREPLTGRHSWEDECFIRLREPM
jgi:hypothetical protein